MNFFKWYNKSLQSRPIVTKMITSFITFGSGDIICQQIEKSKNKNKNFDIMRTIKQGTFGFLVTPYLHLQFCKIMPWLFNGKGTINAVKSVAYDQLIGAPIFTCLFFTFLDMSNGKNFNESTKELEKKLMPTLYMNWKIWPVLMFINFSFVPVAYRILYSNIAGMFWSTYLSSAQNA